MTTLLNQNDSERISTLDILRGIALLGILFMNIPVYVNYPPQILNKSSNALTDKNNWMLISDTLVANGGEQYISIGNFLKDSLSDTLKLSSSGFSSSYYYIDDVSVIDITAGIENYAATNFNVNVFPNPASEILTIELTDLKNQDIELTIVDVLGNEIKKQKVKDKKEAIDISQIENGVYFVKITNATGTSQMQKIIIQN